MNFQSKRHKRTFRRNMAKGFFVGTQTRVNQLLDSQDLYWTELEALKRIGFDLAWSIKNWRKFPPGMEEEEKENGETDN